LRENFPDLFLDVGSLNNAARAIGAPKVIFSSLRLPGFARNTFTFFAGKMPAAPD
jgi:hypothetical protein